MRNFCGLQCIYKVILRKAWWARHTYRLQNFVDKSSLSFSLQSIRCDMLNTWKYQTHVRLSWWTNFQSVSNKHSDYWSWKNHQLRPGRALHSRRRRVRSPTSAGISANFQVAKTFQDILQETWGGHIRRGTERFSDSDSHRSTKKGKKTLRPAHALWEHSILLKLYK